MVGQRARLPALVLAGFVVLLALVAYFPFRFDPPRTVVNDVARTPEGTLTFGDTNRARSPNSPGWVADVRASQRFEAVLEARPRLPQRHHAVSIMMLASDAWRTDFGLGQDGTDLLLWLRRGGSTADGSPSFVVADAFAAGRWTTVRVTVGDDVLDVTVDGANRLHTRLAAGSLRTWDGGRVVLGDEVHGGRGWQGELRRARVETAGHSVDYVTPGALAVPRAFFYLPDHVAPFPPHSTGEWLILGLHLLTFLPVGLLIAWTRRPPVRPLPAAVVALGIAVLLAAGKLLFADRHTAVADIAVQFLGALVGAWLARRQLVNRWRARVLRCSPSPRDGTAG